MLASSTGFSPHSCGPCTDFAAWTRGFEPDRRSLRLLRIGTLWMTILSLAALGLVPALSLAAPPSAAAFGAPPAQSHAVLSPDGHWLAWMDQTEAKPRIEIFDLTARKPQRIGALPDRTKLRALTWNDNETLLVTLSETAAARCYSAAAFRGREYFLTIALDPNGQGALMLIIYIYIYIYIKTKCQREGRGCFCRHVGTSRADYATSRGLTL